MKKISLILGSLILVATSVSAKEVVAAPAVKIEPKVAEEKVFVPNGEITLSEEWVGSEYANFPFQRSSRENRKFNRELYTEVLAKLHMAPNHSLELKGEMDDKYSTHDANGRNGRVRYTYQINENTKARVGFEAGYDKEQETEVLVNMKVGAFYLEPSFTNNIVRVKDVRQPHRNEIAWKLGRVVTLPGNISLDISGKLTNKMGEKLPKTEDKYWIEVGAIATKRVELYKNDKTTVNFDFEGGYDTYKIWSDRSHSSSSSANKGNHKNNEFRSFYLYAEPSINVTHSLTPSVDLLGSLKATYANGIESEYNAQDWTTQPSVKVGVKAKF